MKGIIGYLGVSILTLSVILFILEMTKYELPKIIWAYWHNTDIPKDVKQILEHRQRILKEWTFIILTDDTVDNYVTDKPQGFGSLRESHKSDWLRLALLKRYGGCWMDASIIVNSESAFEKLYMDTMNKRVDFTGFYTPRSIQNNDPKTFVESWFIMAPRNSKTIQAWYNEFTNATTIGLLPYRKHVESRYPGMVNSHIYNPNKPEDVYLTVYACLQVVLHTRHDRVMLLDSSKTMYRLHEICWNTEKQDYDSECIVMKIRDDPQTREIPYIKLTHAQRKYFDKIDISDYFN